MDVHLKNMNIFCQQINKQFSLVLSIFLNSNICLLPSSCYTFPWKLVAIIKRSLTCWSYGMGTRTSAPQQW
jgi:hypothetical protein